MFLWLCHHSSKLNLTTVRKSPANEVVVALLSFLIVWILDTVNMVLLFFQFKLKWLYTLHARRKKSVKWKSFDTFLKKSYFYFDIFSRRVSFPFKCGKPFPAIWKAKKSKYSWTIVTPHEDTEFSELVNLCPVKKFFPYFYPCSFWKTSGYSLNIFSLKNCFH